MDTDRELTILLTLKDRTAYTFRWLDYAERARVPFKILIADGGVEDAVSLALADRRRYPNVDYDYLRYGHDASYADYYAKIVDALARVRTPYVVMADNDDFFVARTLRDSVRFLSSNPDYVACGGQQVIFRLEPRPGRDWRHPYGRAARWKCTRDLRSVEADGAGARLRQQAISNADAFYDVKRTDLARQEFATVRELGLTDLFLMEHLVLFLTAVAGRTRRLEATSIVRQHGSPDSSGGDHELKHGDWLGRMLSPSWSTEFAKFVDAIATGLAAADGIALESARDEVRRAYRMAVAPSLLSDVLDEPTVTPSMSAWTTLVRRLISLPEDSLLRRTVRRFYWQARWISADAVYGKGLLARPVARAEEDLAPIREFLIREP